jgi:hypothetical protein
MPPMCYNTKPILGIKGEDGRIVMSDQDKAEIFNHHFSTIGEKLAKNQFAIDEQTIINRVTPTVMDIDLTYENVSKAVMKLKPDKACGPDKVASRLLKKAGHTIIIIFV